MSAPPPASAPAPEFSRLYRRDEVGRMAGSLSIAATPAECAALAARFGFLSLDALEAEFALEADGPAVVATGRVRARLVQPCVATGQGVPESIDAPFAIRFVPEGPGAGGEVDGDGIELDAQDCDIVPLVDGRIDMGEAVAETLALAVDPFPRSPGADAFLREMGVKSEEEAQADASPFAALRNIGK